MNSRQLHYFIVLAEELHFGRAAARLNIAQPALSQQLQTLEKQLDCALLLRDRRNVRLTPAGQALLLEARKVVSSVERALAAVDSVKKGLRGTLRLGYVGSSMMDPRLPTLIRLFSERYPDVELKLEETHVEHQLQLLSNDALDIALVRMPLPANADIATQTFSSQPLMAALPEGHPLLKHSKINPAMLSQESFLLLDDPFGMALLDDVLATCRRAGFAPKPGLKVQQLTTLLGLVAAGQGVGLVPTLSGALAMKGVVLRPLTDPEAVSVLCFAWLAKTRNKLVSNLLALGGE
ncbi:LysR family transcriptional regulator [Gallaecimonas mangrovi]|uniref:LysR family transcriptional regulator n=1 Tax=Gallaecimonas mangrovi TaxID=2291597 RepID=UPI000E207059|nr:LysR family transcriptional regulator [Gallaecimonas mangrovi]